MPLASRVYLESNSTVSHLVQQDKKVLIVVLCPRGWSFNTFSFFFQPYTFAESTSNEPEEEALECVTENIEIDDDEDDDEEEEDDGLHLLSHE